MEVARRLAHQRQEAYLALDIRADVDVLGHGAENRVVLAGLDLSEDLGATAVHVLDKHQFLRLVYPRVALLVEAKLTLSVTSPAE